MVSRLRKMRKEQTSKKSGMNKYLLAAVGIVAVGLVAMIFMLSLPPENAGNNGSGNYIDTSFTKNITPTSILTFRSSNNEICTENGKPVVRLLSTTWCQHCKWIKPAFDSAVTEYVNEGKIIAYHWELDTGDNTLTPEMETAVPDSEKAIYFQFNPDGTVPTFIFGCKYYRIANGYEDLQTREELAQEAGEFKAVIEKILEDAAK